MNATRTTICSQTLDAKRAELFSEAVKSHYWFELFMDDLPVWGFVGEVRSEGTEHEQVLIYTHKRFDVGFNGNRVRWPGYQHGVPACS